MVIARQSQRVGGCRGGGLRHLSKPGARKAPCENVMNRRKAKWPVLLLASMAGIFVLHGCSSMGDAGLAEADFVAQYADVMCSGNEKCCLASQYPFNHDACVAQIKRTWPTDSFGSYSAQYASECIAGISKLQGCPEANQPQESALKYVCDSIFAGPNKIGEACLNNGECATARDGLVSCSGGVCELSRYAHEGDDCSGAPPFVHCNVWGLFCDAVTSKCRRARQPGAKCTVGDSEDSCERGTCNNDVCPAIGQLGASCLSDATCADDAHCQPIQYSQAGVCVARKLPGEPCTDRVDACLSGYCSLGRCSSGAATAEFCAGT